MSFGSVWVQAGGGAIHVTEVAEKKRGIAKKFILFTWFSKLHFKNYVQKWHAQSVIIFQDNSQEESLLHLRTFEWASLQLEFCGQF